MLQAAFAVAMRLVHSKGHVVCSDPNLQELMWYNVAMDCQKSLINYALGVESIFSYVLRILLVMSDHPPLPVTLTFSSVTPYVVTTHGLETED